MANDPPTKVLDFVAAEKRLHAYRRGEISVGSLRYLLVIEAGVDHAMLDSMIKAIDETSLEEIAERERLDAEAAAEGYGGPITIETR